MNVFKINRGLEANLPAVLTNGCCYFCTDTTNFYIDHEDKNGALTRSKLSSKYADTLRYTEDGNFVEINPTDIVTKNNYETTISVASTDKNGLMSSADKTKLNNIPEDISASLANDFISAKGGAYSLDTTLQLSLNNIPTVISGLYDNPIFRISTDGLKYSESDTKSYNFESYFSPIALVLHRNNSEVDQPIASCFLPNLWQLLDDVTDGDHKKFYVRPNSFQWKRYNGGWKNHYISAELDKLKIYNDQKLISFENSKLENIASPTADNDAATKKYVDDKIPVEATTTTSGLLSAEDKIKLDSVESGANKNVQVDWNQNDSTAEDYVKNRICYENNDPTVVVDEDIGEASTDETATVIMSASTYVYQLSDSVLSSNTALKVTITVDSYSQTVTLGTDIMNNPLTFGNTEIRFMWQQGYRYAIGPYIGSETTLTGKHIKIVTENHEIKQIDSKFLPNYPVYATCTSAANSNKVATTDFDFSLSAGRRVAVKFTNANTKSQPSLNINSTGNKSIIWNSQTLPSTQYWKAGSLVEFVYDGSHYQVVGTINDTTYSAATTSSQGLMSAADKTKLNGIAQNANNYTLPVATADTLGGVKPTVKTDAMTKEVGIDADGKLYVDEHTMIVAFTNSSSGLVSDKTYAEIKEAYESGKRVCATCSLSGYNMLLQLSSFEKKSDIDVVLFTGVGGSSRVVLIVYSNDNHVNLATQNFVSDYQGTENADKILGINSSGYVTTIDKPTFTIDTTLTKSGQAADAKTVGDTFISSSANLMVEIDKKANSSDIPDISGKVDKLQGTENAGKLLSVGNDGNVTTLSADNFLSSSGGEYTTNGVYKFIKASTGNYVKINSNNSSMEIYVADTSNAVGRSVGMTDYGFYIMSRDSEDGSMQLFKNKLTIFNEGRAGTHEINIGINDAHNTYISSYTKKLYFEESVLKNIGTPVDSTDAVTKKYVDEKFASVTIKTWTAADMT